MKEYVGFSTRKRVARKMELKEVRQRPCLRCDRLFMASVENRICKSCTKTIGDNEYSEFRGGPE